jgi:hypothetical protein
MLKVITLSCTGARPAAPEGLPGESLLQAEEISQQNSIESADAGNRTILR